jgi:hypothetical protein
MSVIEAPSEFRVEKRRVAASVILANGDTVRGSFFVACGSPYHEGPERVGELLNADSGLFPLERSDVGRPRTVLYNRSAVVAVSLADPEARRVPGYDLATRRAVSLLLSTNLRITGAVCIYRPEGRDRLSDWARDKSTFRYVETEEATLLVNVHHIVEVGELEPR